MDNPNSWYYPTLIKTLKEKFVQITVDDDKNGAPASVIACDKETGEILGEGINDKH